MSKARRILIVDDNAENIKVAAETLNADNVSLAFAQSGKEALERLERGGYDLILMDVLMPGMDGFEATRHIKALPDHAQTPIIFLTALTDEESLEEAFAAGGVDYISKPFRSRELLARVHHQLERKDFIERLDVMASRDMLTGVYNRRKFFELATDLFHQHEVSLFGAIMDIDFFKKVNDTYGHKAGDLVLQHVTATITARVSDEAIFGRIGGEEFALVFMAESIDTATKLLEKIRGAVNSAVCTLQDMTEVQCTLSIGLALKGEDTISIDHLLQEADKALYGAKESGRNRVKVRHRG